MGVMERAFESVCARRDSNPQPPGPYTGSLAVVGAPPWFSAFPPDCDSLTGTGIAGTELAASQTRKWAHRGELPFNAQVRSRDRARSIRAYRFGQTVAHSHFMKAG